MFVRLCDHRASFLAVESEKTGTRHFEVEVESVTATEI